MDTKQPSFSVPNVTNEGWVRSKSQIKMILTQRVELWVLQALLTYKSFGHDDGLFNVLAGACERERSSLPAGRNSTKGNKLSESGHFGRSWM